MSVSAVYQCLRDADSSNEPQLCLLTRYVHALPLAGCACAHVCGGCLKRLRGHDRMGGSRRPRKQLLTNGMHAATTVRPTPLGTPKTKERFCNGTATPVSEMAAVVTATRNGVETTRVCEENPVCHLIVTNRDRADSDQHIIVPPWRLCTRNMV